jgi:hypothetical protein
VGRRPPLRVNAWLIAGLLANLAGGVAALIADGYGGGSWAFPLRGALVVISVICLVVFSLQLWRWHKIQRTRAER